MAGELFTDINVAVSQSTAAPLSTLTQSVKAQHDYARPISLCLYPTRDLGLDVIDGADEDGAPTPTAVYTECVSPNPWSDD